MVIGAFGISFGLLLFGPKLIRMVGQEITKLNPMRAYCVALSAAITVIIASGWDCRCRRPISRWGASSASASTANGTPSGGRGR
jgi:hypothetical protein